MADPFWDHFTVKSVSKEEVVIHFHNSDMQSRWLQWLKKYTGYPQQWLMGGLLKQREGNHVGFSNEAVGALKDGVALNPKGLLGDYFRLNERFIDVLMKCYLGEHPQGIPTIWERLMG